MTVPIRGNSPKADFDSLRKRIKGTLKFAGAGEVAVSRDTLEECLRLLGLAEEAICGKIVIESSSNAE